MELFHQLNWKIDVARKVSLDFRWKTENFHPNLRVLPLNRLYLPLEGEGEMWIGDKHYLLRPGSIFLLPLLTRVRLKCDHNLVKYFTHFNCGLRESDLDLFSLVHLPVELPVRDRQMTEELFRILVKNHFSPGKGNSLSLQSRLESEGAISLLLAPFFEKTTDILWNDPQNNSRLLQILIYIETHISESFSLEKMATEFHLNPHYLSSNFCSQMKIPLIRYCNRRRISRAVNLLINTEKTVAEIAYELGSNDPISFAKLFKRYLHVTPSEFRQSQRQLQKNNGTL